MMSFPVSPCLAEPADTVRAAGVVRGVFAGEDGMLREIIAGMARSTMR